MIRILSVFLSLILLMPPALAETFEIKMLNRGKSGSMVFEPDYLKVKPGDTVVFRAVQKSHNAASIAGMVPEGFTAFKSGIDEELHVTFDKAGFYGIKCTPHYAMGMIMLIKVGDAVLPDDYRKVKQPGLARKRFDAIFQRVDAGE